jgi:glyoxalase family protein
MKRLEKFNVNVSHPQQRFDDEVFVSIEDVHGLGLELVFNKNDQRPGFTHGQIPVEHAVKGFFGASLAEEGFEKTAALLLGSMDHQLIVEKGNRFRYSASGRPGDFIDILCVPDDMRGLSGSGTIHHLAFATQDDVSQLEVREKLLTKGLNVTPVLDRQYFRSIYFREPGGVLFEVATLPPGFVVDEQLSHLGESLKLPSWLEPTRAEIEKKLTPIKVETDKFMD